MQPSDRSDTTFPVLPAKNWWALRKQFQRTLPRQVDPAYLSNLLHISSAAAANVLRALKSVGLVDADGAPTERAAKWRFDEQYAAACEEIRTEIYPAGLLDLYSDQDVDRAAVTRWFANQTRVGQDTARQMAALYLLLLEADPSQETKADKPRPATKPDRLTRNTRKKPEPPVSEAAKNADRQDGSVQTPSPPSDNPTLHIDLQIHISPEATPQQIDSIFASMAKHLYRR